MVLIYTEKKSPRLEYIAKVIFNDILGSDVIISTDKTEFIQSKLPKINYSNQNPDKGAFLKPHPFIFENDLKYPDFQLIEYKNEKCFFKTTGDSFLPFDPFAASFFVVSRIEEYLETEKGKYDCYPAEKSILFKANLLKKPIVNIWAKFLAEKMKEQFPDFEVKKPAFRFISTIDIDNAWAFRNKGFLRGMGALIKDSLTGRWKTKVQRIKTWLNISDDPYNTYSFINEVFAGNEKNIIFFFLLGDYKKYDKSISYKNKNFRKLIQETSNKYKVGIHPSFFSSTVEGRENLQKEIRRLEEVAGNKPNKSRQHFLRLFFPSTYQRLIGQGILEDYSMGYSSHTGFRAGICTPHYFYDLEAEKETNLKIYPFHVMDVTLREYLFLGVEEAKTEIRNLMEEVEKVGGTFISVWHNESLSNLGNWKGYREVFEFINEKGFSLTNE